MRKLLIPLLAAFALPTAVNAESVWLVLRYMGYNERSSAGGLEKIEMKDMDQCQLMGAKWVSTGRTTYEHIVTTFGFECIQGK